MSSWLKVQVHPTDHLLTLQRCGGYYECPQDTDGNCLGPLVGYAGKYQADGGQKQWVGYAYANCAKADEHPHVLMHFADALVAKVGDRQLCATVQRFCAAPIGGYSFAQMLGLSGGPPVIKAEKKTIALATPTAREQSDLVFARHEVEPGVSYGIVEDVCNNFSTTDLLIDRINSLGGKVTAIFCILNRSPTVGDMFTPKNHPSQPIPVYSLVGKVIAEYRQNDAKVADQIARGNVVWKPKDRWPFLMSHMQAK